MRQKHRAWCCVCVCVCVCVCYDARESLSRRDRLVIAARISFFLSFFYVDVEREPRPSYEDFCRNLENFSSKTTFCYCYVLLTLLCDSLLRFCCCLSKSYSLTLSLALLNARAPVAFCLLFLHLFSSSVSSSSLSLCLVGPRRGGGGGGGEN